MRTTFSLPALAAGSRIHTNSWGHNAIPNTPMAGTYSWRSQLIDGYLHNPAFREQSVLFAVGNTGCEVATAAPTRLFTCRTRRTPKTRWRSAAA